MKTILPQDPAEHNYVFHRHENLNKSSIVYSILLICVIVSLLAMPWIRIDSVTTSPGVVTPSVEPFKMRSKSTGKLNLFNLEENRFVVRGDTLFSIRRKGLKSAEVYRAPIDGRVRYLRSEADASIVKSGEMILEIHPKADFIVRCYLSGYNIASLQPEQSVEFQFQSARRETNKPLSGKIKDILPSISRKEKAAIFEVRCSIDDAFENDLHASRLKPGMTLLARFRLARRSAFDIILKDVEHIDRNPS